MIKAKLPLVSSRDWDLASYAYDLPESLIAKRPIQYRHYSRLLVYHAQADTLQHSVFYKLPEFLSAQSTLVFNNSKVFPCRLQARKKTGGAMEVFFLALTPEASGFYKVFLKSSGRKKVGDEFIHADARLVVEQVHTDGSFSVSFSGPDLSTYLSHHGKIPLPPYIREGKADAQDRKDYQTTYAQEVGSVAAPTAGLHFSKELRYRLQEQGHQLADVTLHVGAGTFQPVKTSSILEHVMHSESYSINARNAFHLQKGRLIAIGTTSLRVVESAPHFFGPTQGSTQAFFYPGHSPQKIQGLLTNFHLPKSTLLMLVSSLIGREKTLELYQEAVKQSYRFYSYGDAMLILLGES